MLKYKPIPTFSPRSAVRSAGVASAARSFAAYGAPAISWSRVQITGVTASAYALGLERRGVPGPFSDCLPTRTPGTVQCECLTVEMLSPEPEVVARNALLTTPPVCKQPVASVVTPVGRSCNAATPTTDEMADRLLRDAELSGIKFTPHPAARHAVQRAADEVKATLDFDDVTELSVAQALRLCPALSKQHALKAEEHQARASAATRAGQSVLAHQTKPFFCR